MDSLIELEEKIEYEFLSKELLLTALTHSSYHNEHKGEGECNERLEFLGDAVLSIVCTEYLYTKAKGNEGDLSRLRASMVCEEALCEYASVIGLGAYIYLGKGEQKEGRLRPSILADATEALLGAVYLDGGIKPARKFILPFLKEKYASIKNARDYKTILQEIVQKNPGEKLSYALVSEQGPAHDRIFVCAVHINSNEMAQGEGKTKKAAEQEAAKKALELMGVKL
ncbi:MAG: ribonuclease III [Clostridiales bacterium]|nr:MAG: ribonuclease III [Clostridiales bacterium]